MITGTYEELQSIAAHHTCAAHPNQGLVVSWLPENLFVLRCGAGHYPDKLQKLISFTEAYRQGKEIPIEVRNKIKRRQKRMTYSESKNEEEVKERLPAIYEAATGSLVTKELRLAAIEYARSVGLMPELGHICLYHGKPWVTIDGWYYRFRRKHPLGWLTTTPLLGNDRLALMVEEGVHAWKAEAYEGEGGGCLSVGYGYAREGEEPLVYKSAVEPRWPWRMAEKRAEEDALRKAVPLEIEEK